MPDDPWPSFRPARLLRELAEGGVDFVVIGGFAAITHGGVRLTNDLDIAYSGEPDNLERLGRVLVELDARLRGVPDDVPFVPDARTLRDVRVLTLQTAHGLVDVLAEPAGAPDYARLREAAQVVDLDGVEVRVAALDHLLAMKRAAGRPKDLADIAELQALRHLAEQEAGGP